MKDYLLGCWEMAGLIVGGVRLAFLEIREGRKE